MGTRSDQIMGLMRADVPHDLAVPSINSLAVHVSFSFLRCDPLRIASIITRPALGFIDLGRFNALNAAFLP